MGSNTHSDSNWVIVAGWLAGAGMLFAASLVQAFPQIYQEWSATYPQATADDDLIATAGAPCQMCHVNPGGGSPWNQYGFAILSNGGFANVPAAFFKVETLDSDGEGNANLAEINAGSLPGWCDSSRPGCVNLAWTRAGDSSPAMPPTGVTLDPPAGAVPPIAVTNGPYAGIAGTRMRFSGQASYDPDGDIIGWYWKFGDSGSATGSTPVHAFASEGTYTVSLVVLDADGLRDIATTTAVIASAQTAQPPIADAGGPYTGFEMVPLTLDGSGSFDLDGVVTQWQWNFGDATTGSGEMPVHTYSAAGQYKVSLVVTDNDGESASASTIATITQPVGEGEAIFRGVCQACHGDPWDGPAIDSSLVAGRRNTGARLCSIRGAIYGNAVFPGGIPEMQFLQGVYTNAQLAAVSGFLNSRLPVDSQRRFVTTCAGCHGTDAAGGRVDRDIRGDDPADILRALNDEPEMGYLNCLPTSPDIFQIGAYLMSLDDN